MTNILNLYDQLQDSVQYIKNRAPIQPKVGLILGTGLSGLADQIKQAVIIPYKDIPHFPQSTVQSHRGQLILGYLADIPIIAMAGRFHYYEGYSMQELTFPVRVLKLMGIDCLFISNAAGSTNANINAGDIVFIKDHINLQGDNPLRGQNDERLGPRFPDMLYAYNKDLNQMALQIAQKVGIRATEGVYVGLAGPNLETPAEYRFLNTIGGDVVGMSTVPEVLVAKHMDLKVFVASVVSNKCFPLEEIKETSVEDVIEVVERTAASLQLIITQMLQELYG